MTKDIFTQIPQIQKKRSALAVIFIIVSQSVAFTVIWSLLVVYARSKDRFPRELFSGVTFYYGTIWIICLFIFCGILTLLSTSSLKRWTAILVGLLVWLVCLLPTFGSRPLAMPAFFVLGSSILIVGTGMIMPRVLKHLGKPLHTL